MEPGFSNVLGPDKKSLFASRAASLFLQKKKRLLHCIKLISGIAER
jgi:hypothetical protein